MPRRGENIYKRKDNRWEGRFKKGVDSYGNPIYQSVYARSYLGCKNKLKNLSHNTMSPVCIPTSSLPAFDDICQQWLVGIKSTVKNSTYAVYHYTLTRYISVYFREAQGSDITRDMIEYFIAHLLEQGGKDGKKGLSVKTVSGILIILKSILSFMERQYHIKSPFVHIKMPKMEEKKDAVLSSGEWVKLSAALEVNKDITAAAIAIGLYTGMRIGELCALKRSDIDFSENIIHVRQTVQRIRNLESKTEEKTQLTLSRPKSAKSVRDIPISDRLSEQLKILCTGKHNDSFILGIDGKKPLEPRTLQYRFKAFLKNIGIRNIHFHVLRHTFATRCMERNMDVKTLSEILGHASVKITLERYVHSSMEFKRIQMNRIETAI